MLGKDRPRANTTARALEEPRAASGGRRTYDKADTATSLRVPAAKLDQFVDLVGELVTVQARLSEVCRRAATIPMWPRWQKRSSG